MKMLNDWKLENGLWYRLYCTGYDEYGDEIHEWKCEDITVIPVMTLIRTWEKLVRELSEKQVELYQLKEAYLIAERQIVETTDFKSIYGANNQKVRDNHVKAELSDMVEQRASLQFGIDFIQSYIPLLRECIRAKQS